MQIRYKTPGLVAIRLLFALLVLAACDEQSNPTINAVLPPAATVQGVNAVASQVASSISAVAVTSPAMTNSQATLLLTTNATLTPTLTTMPVSSIAVSTTPNATSTISDLIQSCLSANLAAQSYWQDNPGVSGLTGNLIFINQGSSPCSLTGFPQIQISRSDNRAITVNQVRPANIQSPFSSIAILQSHQSISVFLSLRGLCGGIDPKATSTLKLKVILAGDMQQLLVSAPTLDAYDCFSDPIPSKLQVGPFEQNPNTVVNYTADAILQSRAAYQTAKPADRATFIASIPTITPIPPIPNAAQNCSVDDLTITVSKTYAINGGHAAEQLTLKNKGGGTCTLQGYPKIQLLNTQGQAVVTDVLYKYINPTTKQQELHSDIPTNTQLVGVPLGKTVVSTIEHDRCSFGVAGSNLNGNQISIILPGNIGELTLPYIWSAKDSNCDKSSGVRISAFAYSAYP